VAYNDYEKMNPYHQYGDPDDPSPYELLNQMKSWDKAIRLTVTALSEETQAQLVILEDQITAAVTDVTQQMNTSIGVLNGKIELKVTKGESIADINVTPTAIRIRADKVNLDGYTTFTALSTQGMTAIHGGNIITQTIVADKIASNQIATRHIQTDAITANQLAANSVFAGAIQSNAVMANNIQSYAIQSYHITSNAITADKIYANAIESYHVSASGITADKIVGGTIMSSYISVSTDVTVGRVLNIGTHYSDYEEKTIRFGGGTGGQIRHYNDTLRLGAFNGVSIDGDLYVSGNYGNVAKTDTSGLSFAVSGRMLRVYLFGSGVGSVQLT